jgi:hypothetical protein
MSQLLLPTSKPNLTKPVFVMPICRRLNNGDVKRIKASVAVAYNHYFLRVPVNKSLSYSIKLVSCTIEGTSPEEKSPVYHAKKASYVLSFCGDLAYLWTIICINNNFGFLPSSALLFIGVSW